MVLGGDVTDREVEFRNNLKTYEYQYWTAYYLTNWGIIREWKRAGFNRWAMTAHFDMIFIESQYVHSYLLSRTTEQPRSPSNDRGIPIRKFRMIPSILLRGSISSFLRLQLYIESFKLFYISIHFTYHDYISRTTLYMKIINRLLTFNNVFLILRNGFSVWNK